MKRLESLLSKQRTEIFVVAAVVVLALILRSVGHFTAPNGWRDDELSNALVVSQHVLNGDVRLYYDDASGHEGLYHWLQAMTMALFGPGVWGIRGVSILSGTASVFLTYLLTRLLFDKRTALLVSLLLAVSFWSLMYSRSGQRHILVTVTTLFAFILFWRALKRRSVPYFVAAGVALGVGFYTYFASRGVPLILIVWGLYLIIFDRPQWKQAWKGLFVTLGTAAILSIPLFVVLQQQPEAEARVEELALPIYDALDGNFTTLGQYTLTTASMFTHDGDSEVLYNVARRPVFGLLGGILFWSGVGFALYQALSPKRDARAAFLLLWLGAGLAPGALSVPAASLGHTILAQPVSMIFPIYALTTLADHFRQHKQIISSVALVLVAWEAGRGIYDYWWRWPTDDFNRVLHHSDFHEASVWLNQQETRDVAMGSFLTERWDQQALQIDLEDSTWQVRAYDPRLVCFHDMLVVIPVYLVDQMAACSQAQVIDSALRPFLIAQETNPTGNLMPKITFDNNLDLLAVRMTEDGSSVFVETHWRVTDTLDLPPRPLFSKPPPPGADDRPRLMLFIQLLDESGQRVTGVDALGVDPHTLRTGDHFTQVNVIDLNAVLVGDYQLVLGLYDPISGIRVMGTSAGSDVASNNFAIDIIAVPELQ